MKYFKKYDFIVIGIVIVLGISSLFLLNANQNVEGDMLVNVYSDNKLISSKVLREGIDETMIVDYNDHINVIEYKDNKVSIIEADCKDQICIKDGEISKNGEIIVCLPNKLMIEIVGSKEVLIDGISQ